MPVILAKEGVACPLTGIIIYFLLSVLHRGAARCKVVGRGWLSRSRFLSFSGMMGTETHEVETFGSAGLFAVSTPYGVTCRQLKSSVAERLGLKPASLPLFALFQGPLGAPRRSVNCIYCYNYMFVRFCRISLHNTKNVCCSCCYS